jgi:hypothetical protein
MQCGAVATVKWNGDAKGCFSSDFMAETGSKATEFQVTNRKKA